MNLNEFAISKKPVTFKPTFGDKELDIEFYVLSKISDQYRALQSEFYRELVSNKDETIKNTSKWNVKLISSCITGWKNIDMDGEEFLYTEENKEKLLSDPSYLWLLNQLDAFINSDTNFLPKKSSPKNSKKS